MVAHTCSVSTQETETLRVKGLMQTSVYDMLLHSYTHWVVTTCTRWPQNLTSRPSVTKVGEAHRVSLRIYMQIVVNEKETF